MRSIRCPCGETIPLQDGAAFGRCTACNSLVLVDQAEPPGAAWSRLAELVAGCLLVGACVVAVVAGLVTLR